MYDEQIWKVCLNLTLQLWKEGWRARWGGLTNGRPENWSGDLRANERPQNKHHGEGTDGWTDIATYWNNCPGADSLKILWEPSWNQFQCPQIFPRKKYLHTIFRRSHPQDSPLAGVFPQSYPVPSASQIPANPLWLFSWLDTVSSSIEGIWPGRGSSFTTYTLPMGNKHSNIRQRYSTHQKC